MSRRTLRKPLSILSVNVGKGHTSHELALALAFDSSIDILLIQEPYINKAYARRLTKKHPSYECFSPVDSWEHHPRVLTYARKGVGLRTSQTYLLPHGHPAANDLLSLTIQTTSDNSLTIVNVYNAPPGSPSRENLAATTLLSLPPPALPPHTFIAGDFNLHHHLWQPSYSGFITPTAQSLVSWLESQDLSLISQADVQTHKRGNVLDLAFATPTVVYRGACTDVDRELDATSDHYPLHTTIPWDCRNSEPLTRLKLASLREDIFSPLLQSNLENLPLSLSPFLGLPGQLRSRACRSNP